MKIGGVPPLPQDLLEDPVLETAESATSPLLREFEAAWATWPKRGPLPPRSTFDPVDFPRFLPWIMLLEFNDHPNRYRGYDGLHRYLGSSVAELFKADGVTGTYVSALPDPFPERWFSGYDRLIARRGPLVLRGKPYLVGKAYKRFELVMMPLCRNEDDTGRAVGFSLCCVQEQPVG